MTEELAPQTIYSIQQWDIWKAVSNNDIGQLGTVMDNNMKYYISCIDANPKYESMPIQNYVLQKRKMLRFYANEKIWVKKVCENDTKFLVYWRNKIYIFLKHHVLM